MKSVALLLSISVAPMGAAGSIGREVSCCVNHVLKRGGDTSIHCCFCYDHGTVRKAFEELVALVACMGMQKVTPRVPSKLVKPPESCMHVQYKYESM